jgi:hypothetical protein
LAGGEPGNCFNFGFLRGAPVYVAALDPQGLFNAWKALVFCVTIVAAMFLIVDFDLWPLTMFPKVMRQPVLGIVWSIIAVVLVGIAFFLGVGAAGMDPMTFLVRVPVPFIFGSIIVLNMFQGMLFQKLERPMNLQSQRTGAVPEQGYPTRSLRVTSSAAGVTANCFLGFLE